MGIANRPERTLAALDSRWHHAMAARIPSPVQYATGSGASIAFQVVGSGGIDLVMVPGLISHLDLEWQNPRYRRFIRMLARSCRVIRFDKRGTGLSDPTAHLPSLRDRVNDLSAVLKAANSRRPVIMGLSEGARTAIAFAALYPHRTLALLLYGSSYRTPPHSARMRALQSMLQHWGEGRIVDIFAPSIASDDARRAAGAFERAAASPAMARAAVETLGLLDARDLMADLRVPTLVLHRRAEAIPVKDARTVAHLIPSARLVIIPGRDHLPWVGDSDSVVAEITAFLTSLALPSTAPRARTSHRPTPTSRPRGTTGWASLTKAELRVVRLVVEGLTNRGAADRLFLSPYTVETHLKHVFLKLGVRTRAELATLAATRADEDT